MRIFSQPAESIIENEAERPGMLAMSAEDELSADSDRRPVLPPEADSREGIYGNTNSTVQDTGDQ